MQLWHACLIALGGYVLARYTCKCPRCPPMFLEDPDFQEGRHRLAYLSALDIQQLRAADGLPATGPTFFSYDTGTGTVQRHM